MIYDPRLDAWQHVAYDLPLTRQPTEAELPDWLEWAELGRAARPDQAEFDARLIRESSSG